MTKRIALFIFLLLSGICFAEESFAKFGYFIDKLEFPVKNVGKIWATPHSVYEGPFRTNDALSIYLPPHYLDEGRLPFFRGPVETASSSIVYYDGIQPNERELQSIFQSDVKTGVPPIPFPEHANLDLKKAASAGLFSKDDIFLPHDDQNRLTGGIVINGDVADLEMNSDDKKNFKMIVIKDKRNAYEVDVRDGQTVLILPNAKAIVYSGVPNGAIYADGDIGIDNGRHVSGLHGKVHGRWTVAAKGDIYIPDNLLYDDTPKGVLPQGNDVLALVARNVFINREAPDLLFLYATVFAGEREKKANVGSLFVLSSVDSPHEGQIFWFGNYIGAYPAIMGRFDRATGQSTDGYDLHKFYDARLATNPPPFFPRIGN